MTDEMTIAVDRLTKPWTDVHTVEGEYKAVDYDPLLDMLRVAISSSVGRTDAGRSGADTRNVLNLNAFTVWERIDGQARAWLKDLHTAAPKDLKDAVTKLHVHVRNLWASHQINEPDYIRLGDMAKRWADDIWAIFDPPVTKEIIGACPECGEANHFGPEGERSAAITAYYWKGVPPTAKCQRCQQEWAGRTQLVQLAYRIGARVDEEALHELGDL